VAAASYSTRLVSSIILPQLPNLGSRLTIAFHRSGCARVEPANEFLVDYVLHVLCRFTGVKPRQNCSSLRVILVGVYFKIDSSRIMPEEECSDGIEQRAIFRSQLPTFL